MCQALCAAPIASLLAILGAAEINPHRRPLEFGTAQVMIEPCDRFLDQGPGRAAREIESALLGFVQHDAAWLADRLSGEAYLTSPTGSFPVPPTARLLDSTGMTGAG
jgi:hypothetical protein